MDISINQIDLQYLTNPLEMNKIKQSKKLLQLRASDLKFYKRRIFQFTKDILNGEKPDKKVCHAFENYALTCIDHFKFIDRMELIQGDYKDIKSKKVTIGKFDIGESNKIMSRQKKPYRPKITDHIDIKTNYVKKKPIIPTQRKLNISSARFRDKGLKKKNINN